MDQEVDYIYTIFFHGIPPRIIQTIFSKFFTQYVDPEEYFNTYQAYLQSLFRLQTLKCMQC
jgi:hypothetical protein